MKYYILFNNDSPELVYTSEADAKAEAKRRQKASNGQGYTPQYWHVHEVQGA
jgi:hypothetical protein